ncbi:MAG: MFS transporter [Pirellulaceae bacterium]|nr:MFS transporter [Pirellulaceae bacterium]
MSVATAPRIAASRPAEPNSPEPPPRLPRSSPRHDLRCSVGDAASYSVMIGIGEAYFAAFALALGTGETFAGLVATLPMLAGATIQLATPHVLRRFHSYRLWVVLCAAVQATALLVMVGAAWLAPRPAAAWVFFVASIYWAASLAAGPGWNTWIEEVIPKRVRANFFACRARISQICTLLGFVVGGLALQVGKAGGWVLAAFVGIFVIGAICRYASATFLSQHSEPSAGKYSIRRVTLRRMVSRTSGEVGGPLIAYLLAVQVVVQISGPYFTPFMLAKEKMDLGYFNYMLLIGICFLGKAIALPFWGRVAHYSGARRLLWIGGLAIVPISSLWCIAGFFDVWRTTIPVNLGVAQFEWLISGQIVYLAIVQLVSGLVWAAYELAMLLMFFEAIPKHSRAGVMTIYNFGNAAALVLGSLIGAAILQSCGEAYGAYLCLFGLSSVGRLATLPLLWRTPARAVEVEVVQPAVRVIAVRPDDGGIDRPILSTLAESKGAGS